MKDLNNIRELIPWYLNGTLNEYERQKVEEYLANNPEGRTLVDEWMHVRNFVQSRDEKLPSPGIDSLLFDRIRSKYIQHLGILHPYALGLSFAIFILLWMIIRPGVVLQWETTRTEATGFKIYRSEVGNNSFKALDEIPANPSTNEYTYVDLFYWPGFDYTYYVESVNKDGSLGIGQVLVTHTNQALPGQLSLLCASFCLGYGILYVIQYRRLLLIGSSRLVAL